MKVIKMLKVKYTKPASGEILLFEIWEEDSAGFNDELTKGAKLTVSPEGDIILKEYREYKPTSRSPSLSESVHTIPIQNLIELITNNSH